MEQRDYVLREIERIGFLLARLRDRVLGRLASSEELRHELQTAARSIGVDLEVARAVDPETLLMLIGSTDVTRRWFFAEALLLEGLDAKEAGRGDDAADLLLRSRMLFESLGAFSEPSLPDVATRLEEIDEALDGG